MAFRTWGISAANTAAESEDKMKGWKTAGVAALITIAGAAQTFFESVTFADEATSGYVLMAIGMVMAGLRAVTTSPIFSEE